LVNHSVNFSFLNYYTYLYVVVFVTWLPSYVESFIPKPTQDDSQIPSQTNNQMQLNVNLNQLNVILQDENNNIPIFFQNLLLTYQNDAISIRISKSFSNESFSFLSFNQQLLFQMTK
jgi:hypothetical protein